jgi:hypothetical protein
VSSSTHKKVICRRVDKDAVRGWVNPQAFLAGDSIELLSLDGQVSQLPLEEVKALHFVREFEDQGEKLERTTFASRPKLEGLWLRLRFKNDGEVLEGILPNNLLHVTGAGVTITPPDPYANSQKIFVPRAALSELTVLGVIGSPAAPSRRKKAEPPSEKQIKLFS